MRLRLLLAVVPILGAGCIDSSRVNRTCTWTDPSSAPLDLSRAADRDHLRMDVQVAGDLGVRLADAQFPGRADLADPIQERCTAALLDTIARRHGVAVSVVRAAETNRVWWGDLLAVYLPLAVVVAFGMDRITRRICRSFDPDGRAVAVATVAFFVPATALLGLLVGQFWGFGVEGWFLRNGHVAFRAFLVPIIRHGWIAYVSLLVLCAVVAIVRWTRTPLHEVGHSYESTLGLSFSRSRAPGAV
jgi:hypothetical protein